MRLLVIDKTNKQKVQRTPSLVKWIGKFHPALKKKIHFLPHFTIIIESQSLFIDTFAEWNNLWGCLLFVIRESKLFSLQRYQIYRNKEIYLICP